LKALLRHRWLGLILLLALVLRSYHVGYPAWDYHSWRQSITLMVARDFARAGFPLLHPHVAWVGRDDPAEPSYFSGEFSIQSILAAILYRLFGERDALARSVTISFSLLGIAFLYDLLRRRSGELSAILGALIYTLLPMHIFFGRVFMPDIPALSLALGGVAWLDRWTGDRKWRTLLMAAVLTMLAVLQKLSVVFIVLPAIYLFWLVYGKRLFARREPYLFAAIALLPPLAWYVHAADLARQSHFAVMQPLIFVRSMGLWMQRPFQKDLLGALTFEVFSPLGLALAVVGILWPMGGRLGWIFRLWIAGAALILFLSPEILSGNHYYFTLLMPACAALAGIALAKCSSFKKLRYLPALIMILFAGGAIRAALPFYAADTWPYEVGSLMNRLTKPEDLIVTETGGSPNVLYYADRRGWMIEKLFVPGVLERWSQRGARYYVDSSIADLSAQPEFFRSMDARFYRLTPEGQDWPWPIYQLSSASASDREPRAGERRIDFGTRIELEGFSARELLAWPAAFEFVYDWRCLRRIAADLRVYARLTGPDGQTAYQQDHWPLNGRSKTSEWNAGENVRERFVVVLPQSLAKGKYKVMVGWFDIATGDRLPIVNPISTDKNHLAAVAEINVKAPPEEGWFSPW
jgi:4-amino-4-deoxy-L-arabinose transferase-like glycosyltransferase